MKAIYTAEATATGGRNGHVKSKNNVLDLEVRSPKALGGANDDYPNPEMLFAAGYSACFDNALNLVITQGVIETGETSVNAKNKHRPNQKRWLWFSGRIRGKYTRSKLKTSKGIGRKSTSSMSLLQCYTW
ncbi:peroxiredoxin, Ohr subfamily [Maribacter orientalis]|uniref:Peroxiredoxin, Ohr subfamily n=1 Tax=Maribacter orientalis TaxID=228957 RepID=A0A1H7SKI2_9FLAO|nr:peroxiredoxin, Ohr subfamily [Maribacter orientalis]